MTHHAGSISACLMFALSLCLYVSVYLCLSFYHSLSLSLSLCFLSLFLLNILFLSHSTSFIFLFVSFCFILFYRPYFSFPYRKPWTYRSARSNRTVRSQTCGAPRGLRGQRVGQEAPPRCRWTTRQPGSDGACGTYRDSGAAGAKRGQWTTGGQGTGRASGKCRGPRTCG